MPLPLGILDQSPVVAGGNAEAAINATIALVKRAEALGFHRFWFAEHHGREHGFSSASPELMIARLAPETRQIRLGSGGVLLSHYSPLKVAENFRLLETFAPGRIDLGLGRGTGADDETGLALGDGAASVPYAERVAELLTFLDGGFPAGHAYAGVRVAPVIDRTPQPWILGSSASSAELAGRLGIPFVYAHFIRGDNPAAPAAYRAAFRSSPRLREPHVMIAIAAFCSDDAQERADYRAVLMLRRARMQLERDPLPPTREEARDHVPSPAEREKMEATARLAIVAAPGDFLARVDDVAGRHLATEAMIVTVAPDYAVRLRSYEAIAGAWGPPA